MYLIDLPLCLILHVKYLLLMLLPLSLPVSFTLFKPLSQTWYLMLLFISLSLRLMQLRFKISHVLVDLGELSLKQTLLVLNEF